MKQLTSLLVLSAVLVFTSCSKDNDDNGTPEVVPTVTTDSVTNVNGSSIDNGGHYTFYSLESGTAVALADSASDKWDLGISNTTLITNGGVSGPGKGGAYVQTSAAFSTFSSIPSDSTFRSDSATAKAIKTGSGNGWYNYDFATNIISPIPGRLLIIRTATGKYAKVEILSYYKDAPVTVDPATAVPRYYTFRYSYQASGSKTF